MWFEFITNTECNWNCSYCSFNRVRSATMTRESIDRHPYLFDYINQQEHSTIVIEGGEIGLITDNDLLEHLFSKFNQKIIVNTNGTFFDTDRSMLYNYIDKVFYHVAPTAKESIKIDELDVPMEVVYGIVDDDQDALDAFCDLNPMISYAELETSCFNMDKYNKTKEKITLCNTMNPFVSIDLSREVLCKCTTRGCHVTIPLIEENFFRVLRKWNVFKSDDICRTCYRLPSELNLMEILDRKRTS